MENRLSINDFKQKRKPILSTLNQQMVLRCLGLYSAERLSIDQYFLLEAINQLIAELGEDFVEEKLKEEGKDWNKTKENLDLITFLIYRNKGFYDYMKNQKLESKDPNKKISEIQEMLERNFRRNLKRLSLLQRELYDLFILLIKNCNISVKTIPEQAFKIPDYDKMQKLDLTQKKNKGFTQLDSPSRQSENTGESKDD